MHKITAKSHLNKDHVIISKIALYNICIGGMIIGLCYFLEVDNTFLRTDSQALPASAWSIFFNNLKVSLLYAVPYIGPVYYTVSFVIIYVIIGVYAISFGAMDTMLRLLHMPLEVFALSMPLVISMQYKKMDWRKMIKILIASSILLFISAYIEFFISRGV